jgi:hypothetical protein
MVVRVKWRYEDSLRKIRDLNRQVALTTGFVLNPLSVASFVLAVWRLGADLNLTGAFAISKGLFSHWQVWLALGAGLQALAVAVNRYAHREPYSPDQRPAV